MEFSTSGLYIVIILAVAIGAFYTILKLNPDRGRKNENAQLRHRQPTHKHDVESHV